MKSDNMTELEASTIKYCLLLIGLMVLFAITINQMASPVTCTWEMSSSAKNFSVAVIGGAVNVTGSDGTFIGKGEVYCRDVEMLLVVLQKK